MVYDWEPHRQTCYSLYVEQKKSLDEVVEYMRVAHNFTPSRRGFQVQFSRWKFPAKYGRAWKDEQLVARVRELWERNLTQKEMLAQLQEEGFKIEMRQLVRVRARFGLRLRETVGAFGMRRTEGEDEDREDGDSDGQGDGGGEEESEDGAGEVGGYGIGQSMSPGTSNTGSATLGEGGSLTPAQIAKKEERKRALEVESQERYATKKRRRRTKGYAGLPADPPGPPRFPSETTLTEARVILELNDDEYKAFRQQFQTICEDAGVIRKTLAGPEKWEALKDQLIRENMHLRAIMWDHEGMEQKRLAIDVIACDVTKRMRATTRVMGIAEAKTLLNLNPQQGREARAALYLILAEDQFTCKNEEGQEHWGELKAKWLAGSDLLQRLSAPTGSDEENRRMTKAIDVLARDVVRRYRDDANKGKLLTNGPPKAPKSKSKTKSTPPVDDAMGTPPAFEFVSVSAPEALSKRLHPRPTSPSQHSRVQPQPDASALPHTHTHARLLPPQMLESPQSALPMDTHAQLDASLLLASDPQNHFVNEQYYPAAQPTAPVYHHHQRHHHPTQPPPVPSATIGVYFRLHPASSVFPGTITTPMWISTITSRSIDELRGAATEKFSGVVCIAIEGIIKDGKGGELLPLPVNDDAELDAYLRHIQGVMAPTFNVQLVSATGRGDWV